MSHSKALLLALLPFVAVVAVRLAGAQDIDYNDQAKQTLYVLDIVENGNWILPLSRATQPATKPPLLPWLAAVFAAVLGGPKLLVCQLPSVLAFLATGWLLFRIAAERWNPAAAVACAWVFASSALPERLSSNVRPDMLLTLCVTAAFFALHRQDRGSGRGMPALFWSAVAFSVLAKGPVGLLVVLCGAAALAFSRERRRRLAPVLRSRWAWALALPVLWFVAAYAAGGTDFLSVVMSQTVERVTASGSREGKGQFPGYLALKFLLAAAPWSFVALAGLWGLFVRRGHASPERRGDLLFAAAWFVPGMVVLNLSAGQRPDYLLPLLPAASLLVVGGLDVGRWRAPARTWRMAVGFYLALACVLSFVLLSGITGGRETLDAYVLHAGTTSGLGLAAAAILLLAALVSARAGSVSPSATLRPVLLVAAGMLVFNLIYLEQLSTVAREDRGAAQQAFIAAVEAERGPADEVVLYGRIRNSVRFHLGLNKPSRTSIEMGWLIETPRPEGRLLVVTTAASELQSRWPGVFEPLFRSQWDRPGRQESVLLRARR